MVSGAPFSILVAEDKGIDVRLALDVIRFGIREEYDVALIFSQDQDLSEVADEVAASAREQGDGSRSLRHIHQAHHRIASGGLIARIGYRSTERLMTRVWTVGTISQSPHEPFSDGVFMRHIPFIGASQ